MRKNDWRFVSTGLSSKFRRNHPWRATHFRQHSHCTTVWRNSFLSSSFLVGISVMQRRVDLGPQVNSPRTVSISCFALCCNISSRFYYFEPIYPFVSITNGCSFFKYPGLRCLDERDHRCGILQSGNQSQWRLSWAQIRDSPRLCPTCLRGGTNLLLSSLQEAVRVAHRRCSRCLEHLKGEPLATAQ